MSYIPPEIVTHLATYLAMARFTLAHLHNLTPHQSVALGLVSDRGSVAFKDLRRLLALPMSSFTFMVDGLEKRDLVKRQRAPDDRRQWLLAATPKGIGLANEMRQNEPAVLESLLNLATPSEKANLAGVIRDKKFADKIGRVEGE